MKTRSFRLLTVLFAVLMLLAQSLDAYAAYGSDVTQDGVKAQLFTDKDSYSANEPVYATVRVDNYTYKELFVFCKISAPEGVVFGNEVTAYDGVMSDGEGWTSAGGIIPRERTGIAGSVATSDNLHPGTWTIMTAIAYCGVVGLFVYGKKKKTWLPMFLCCVMLGGVAAAVVPAQAADVAGRGDIDLNCTIQYDGKDTEIKARVSYVIYAEEEPEDTSLEPDTSWYTGSEKDYTLRTAEELLGFHKLRAEGNSFEGITIKMGADITINEGTVEEIKARGGGNYKWSVLNSTNEFKGTFDGCGYTIYGIYMQLGKSANKGMFGTLGENATIKSFTLDDSYFGGPTEDGKTTFGVIAGQVKGKNITISDVHIASGVIIEEGSGKELDNVGGFVGMITGDPDNLALVTKLTMENCTFAGTVSTTGENAGGMIGHITHSKATVSLKDCAVTGSVTAASNAGKIIGWANKGDITLSDYTEEDDVIGGFNADNVGGSLVITYKDENGEETDPTDPSVPSEDEGEGAEFTADTSWYTYEENRVIEYTLTTAAQLAGFNKLQAEGTTFEGITIKLGNDITINEGDAAQKFANGKLKYTWQLPPEDKPFKGTFDGCGYTIYGIYMEQRASYQGMFGSVEGSSEDKGEPAVIKNFTLENTYAGSTAEKSYFGVVAGRVYGLVEISGITCNAVVEGNMKYVGGLVGSVLGVETGSNQNEAVLTMRNCTFSGSINVSGNNAGGMIGYTSGKNAKITLDGCTTTGSVAAASNAGKIIGWANKGDITLSDYTEEDGVIGSITTNNVAAGSLVITYKDENGEETDPTDPSVPSEDEGEEAKFTADTSWYTYEENRVIEYTLTTAAQLAGFNKLQAEGTTFEGITIKLGNDITLKADEYTWKTSTTLFQGTFDGQDGETTHTITISMPDGTTVSMFGSLGGGAEIKNFTLKGIKSTGGAIASQVSGEVTISNVTCTDVTVTETDYAGGLVGKVDNAILTMKNCEFTGTVSGTYAGKMIGYANSGTILVEKCRGTGALIGGINENNDNTGESDTLNITSVYSGTADKSWYVGEGPYTLITAEQLMGLNELLNAGGTFAGSIKLAADITINESIATPYSWLDVKSTFKGTFDGNGHSISGLYMSTSSTNQGMFGVLGMGAKIKNFTLNNSYFSISADEGFGTIAGSVTGTDVEISGVTCNATIAGDKTSKVGGFVGQVATANAKLTMTDCILGNSASINVSGSSDAKHVGGMIGYVGINTVEVELTNCTNNAQITARTNIGGMIGYFLKATTTLTRCTNSGKLTATVKDAPVAGEMIGYAGSGTITFESCTGSDSSITGKALIKRCDKSVYFTDKTTTE